jgi:hypothetical protein
MLTALVAGVLNGGYQGTYSSLLSYAGQLFPNDPTGLTYFVLVTSNVQLLIVPFALFVVVYLLARQTSFDPMRDYRAMILSLFIGGTIGSAMSSYSVFLFLGSQQKLPDLLSTIVYFADLIVQQLYFGLQVVFVGFTASCIQYVRRRRRLAGIPQRDSNVNKLP